MVGRNVMAQREQRKPFEVIQRETNDFLSSAAALKAKLNGRRILV